MLSSLVPRTHVRLSALPLLGSALEPLCVWLRSNGYPDRAIRRRLAVARELDQSLRRGGVAALGDLTAAQLLSFIPRRSRHRQDVSALVHSLVRCLEERGGLTPPPTTTASRRVDAYQSYLERVRGLAPSTVEFYVQTATAFLRSIDVD